MPPSYFSSLLAPPGGIVASGDNGILSITPRTPPPPDSGQLPPYPNSYDYDVIHWRVFEEFVEEPIFRGGMLGAPSSRRPMYGMRWEASVLIDVRIQIELSLRLITGASFSFFYGYTHVSQVQNKQPRYWCPIAKVKAVSPVVRASNPIQKMRQDLAGVASSHVLLLPDMGDPADVTTIAGAYNAWLTSNPGVYG